MMTHTEMRRLIGYALNELSGAWQQCNCETDDPGMHFREAQRCITRASDTLRKSLRAIDCLTTESQLRHLMRDPRYWRDQDPDFIQKVREGFKTLYEDNGNV